MSGSMSDNDWRFGILNCCLRSYAAWPEHRNFPFVNIHCFTVIRFHNVINTDLNGQFFTCREVVRQSMKPNQYGRIIMVSSIHGVCGRKGVDTAPYAAAKGARSATPGRATASPSTASARATSRRK